MAKLVIIRHSLRQDDNDHFTCTTKGNVVNRNTDTQLSEQGQELCHDKAKQLKQMLNHIDITYTSPFLRTIQTANILTESYKHVKITELFSLAEGQNKYEPAFDKELVNKLRNSGITYPETIRDIKQRCKDTINHVLNDLNNDKNVLIVTHGIIYNYLLKHLYPSYEFTDTHKSTEYVPRCLDITIIQYKNNKFIPLYSDVENVQKLHEYQNI